MKVIFKDTEHFVKNPPKEMRAILLYGPDQGLVKERATVIAKTVVSDLNDPFSYLDLHADIVDKEPSRLLDEAFALSFLGGRKVIRITQADDDITQACKALLENETPCENLVIIEAGNLDTKSALRAYFESAKTKNGAAVACYAEEGKTLDATIRQILSENNKSASFDVIQYLSSNMQSNRMIVRSEIEKLVTYVGTKTAITLDDAQACIGNQSDTSFSVICTAVGTGNIKVLDEKLSLAFMEGIFPQSLIRGLQNHLKRLHKAKILLEKTQNIKEVMEKQIYPAVFWKEQDVFVAQMNKWDIKRLEMMLIILSQAEKQCKMTGIPAETVCRQTFLNIARRARG